MTNRSGEPADAVLGPQGRAPLPEGPWVVVVGMHRSGTSAVTGALGAFGMSVPRPEDRILDSTGNPEHWESHSIMLHNQDVLDRFGGSWEAPPELPSGWVDGPELEGLPDPAPLFSNAYPDPGTLVWKDPRVCLLLPYWRQVVQRPVAVVFVWRSAVAVARSLHDRNGFTLVHGLSLWERYNLQALRGMRGMDVFVLGYEALVDDHLGAVSSVAEWLGSLDVFASGASQWNVAAGASAVTNDLRHHPADSGMDELLLPEHRSITTLLTSLGGGHRRFDPGTMPVESEWVKDVLWSRREARLAIRRESEVWDKVADRVEKVASLEEEVGSLEEKVASSEEKVASLEEELEGLTGDVENMQPSTRWWITKPFRSLVAGTERLAAGVRGSRHVGGGAG